MTKRRAKRGAEAAEPMITTCGRHGRQPSAFVCQHLIDRTGLGFHTVPGQEDTAWCEDCQWVLEMENGWSPRAFAFAYLRLVCKPCFEEIRRAQLPTARWKH